MREPDSGPRPPAPDYIVLVGFMAAGKSTVGRILAERLNRAFVDLDAEIEREEGRSIPEIFRADGEDVFREREAEVTRRLDGAGPLVVAAGGGWMARPALRDRWREALRVWLEVSPEEVLRRLEAEGELESRPVLDPGSPERSIRAILERREPHYARAEHRVSTDGRTPEQVAGRILAFLR